MNPAIIQGHPTVILVKNGEGYKVSLKEASDGIVPNVILAKGPFQFVRYCMRTCEPGQPGDYWYLVDKLRPPWWAQVIMLIVIGMLASAVAYGAVRVDIAGSVDRFLGRDPNMYEVY
jgi:hypothetical protein